MELPDNSIIVNKSIHSGGTNSEMHKLRRSQRKY